MRKKGRPYVKMVDYIQEVKRSHIKKIIVYILKVEGLQLNKDEVFYLYSAIARVALSFVASLFGKGKRKRKITRKTNRRYL